MLWIACCSGGWYVVPQWYLGAYRLAFWNVFGYSEHADAGRFRHR